MKLRILASIALILLLNGCSTDIETIDTNLGELNKIYPLEVSTYKSDLGETLDIYLDYSTCVRDAVDNSSFFKALRPDLTGSQHVLHTIKGTTISPETSTADASNLLMNNVVEVNYANIPGALEQIVNSKNQALLITDGEYVTSPESERWNLPYMKEYLKKWLIGNRGVYIIIEDYFESYNKVNCPKKRFYMLFTDDKLKDNFYTRFKNAGKLNSPDISIFKLTSSDARIIRADERLDSNFDYSSDTLFNSELITIDNSWNDIYKYTSSMESEEEEEETGDEDGEKSDNNILMKGLKFESLNLTRYKIKDIEIRAYNISDVLLDSVHNKILSKPIPSGLKLDKEAFRKKGEIIILITEELQKYLETKKENLIKIDICIRATEVIPIPCEKFVWKAMIAKNKDNISVFESVKQALEEPSLKPENRNSGLLYTIYLKTPEFK